MWAHDATQNSALQQEQQSHLARGHLLRQLLQLGAQRVALLGHGLEGRLQLRYLAAEGGGGSGLLSRTRFGGSHVLLQLLNLGHRLLPAGLGICDLQQQRVDLRCQLLGAGRC